MTYQSALVMTIHRVLAQNRINLAAIAKVTQIPLATIRRVTSPATAPTGLAAWESLLRAIGASVHVEFQGAPSQVDLPDLHAKHLHAVHERLVDRAYAEPSSNLGHRRPKTRVSRKQVSRETTALRNRIVQILDDSLPTGRHRTTSLFAPVAAMISGVAAAGVMGRSFDTLELVTGVPGRTHRQLCTPDEQRPIAILQTVLGMAGVVVVVEHQKARWEIGHSTPVAAPAFLKTTNHQTGATRGAPSHEHLPLAPSQILNALLGERPIFQDLVIAATRAGISATTIRSWERRRRDPLLEALETMTAALGGRIILSGRLQRNLTPIDPSPARLEQAFRQTCSAYRWSVGRTTGLSGNELAEEVRRRVEHTRKRVREHLRLLPSPESNGVVSWIRTRRASLQKHGLGSVLELSLITGLNRSIIDRILLDAAPIDAVHLGAMEELGISILVSLRETPSSTVTDPPLGMAGHP